jgi:hypothetical protein
MDMRTGSAGCHVAAAIASPGSSGGFRAGGLARFAVLCAIVPVSCASGVAPDGSARCDWLLASFLCQP